MASQLLPLTAGAALCGMVYFVMASDMRARTSQVASSLATTSLHLSDPTLLDPSPFHSVITARQRMPPARSLSSDIKAQWNNQVESALGAVRAVEWSHLPSEAAEGVQTVVGLAGELGKRLTGGGDP